MAREGLTILLLDVDGVLIDIHTNRFKVGVVGFVEECKKRFDLVFILSSWQGAIHDLLAHSGVSLPSLAWGHSKCDGLDLLARKASKIVWVEDGFVDKEALYAVGLGIKLLDVHPEASMKSILDRVAEVMR